jgi:hypothetical protein
MSNAQEPRCILPRWLVIGFSGHRHLGENTGAVREAIRQVLDKLSDKYPALAGVSSAASGADTLFAEEMLRRNAPLSIILPFPSDRFRNDFAAEPPGAWPRSQEIIRRALDLQVVHQLRRDLASVLESNLPPEEQIRLSSARDSNAYLEATVRTVDEADLLLAIWDGKPGKGPGGTADAVAYARQIGLPLILIHPETAATAAPVEERQKALFDPSADATLALTPPRQAVEKQFEILEKVASEHGPEARKFMRKYIYLHLVASACGAAGIVLHEWLRVQVSFAAIEIVVLLYALVVLKNRSDHFKKWVPGRLQAEICKSFLHTWNIRRYPMPEHLSRPPLPNQRQLFRQLRFLRHLDTSPLPSLAAARQTYLNDRVVNQIQYFDSKLEVATKSYRWHGRWGQFAAKAAAIVAIIVLILLIFNSGIRTILPSEWLGPLLTGFFELLGILLPLIAAAAGVLLITQEASRRSTRYEQMKAALEQLRTTVAAAPTWEALARAATQVEEELLQELVEWESYVHYTEHLH